MYIHTETIGMVNMNNAWHAPGNPCACGKKATHYGERPLTPRDTLVTHTYLCDECVIVWRAEFVPETNTN